MAAVTCTFLYIMCIFLTACVYGFPTKNSEHSLLKRFREAHGLGMPSNSIFYKGLQDWRIRKRGFGTFPSKLGATSPLRDLDMQDWLTYFLHKPQPRVSFDKHKKLGYKKFSSLGNGGLPQPGLQNWEGYFDRPDRSFGGPDSFGSGSSFGSEDFQDWTLNDQSETPSGDNECNCPCDCQKNTIKTLPVKK